MFYCIFLNAIYWAHVFLFQKHLNNAYNYCCKGVSNKMAERMMVEFFVYNHNFWEPQKSQKGPYSNVSVL